MVLFHEILGLRVAITDGLLSFPSVLVFVSANLFRLSRIDAEIWNLIPQSAYRQRLFFCGSAYFRALLAYDTLRRPSVELEHRWQDSRLFRRGMHYEHFTPSLFLQACCLGSYRFSLSESSTGG